EGDVAGKGAGSARREADRYGLTSSRRQGEGAPGQNAVGGADARRPGDAGAARVLDREGAISRAPRRDAPEIRGRGGRHTEIGTGDTTRRAGARTLVARAIDRGDADEVGGSCRKGRDTRGNGLAAAWRRCRRWHGEERCTRAGRRRGRQIDTVAAEVVELRPIGIGRGCRPAQGYGRSVDAGRGYDETNSGQHRDQQPRARPRCHPCTSASLGATRHGPSSPRDPYAFGLHSEGRSGKEGARANARQSRGKSASTRVGIDRATSER